MFVDSLVAIDADEVFSGGGQLAVGLGCSDLDSLIVGKSAGSLLDHGEDFGESRIELAGIHLEAIIAQVIDFFPEGFALVVVESLDFGTYLGYLILIVGSFAADIIADDVDAVAQVIVRFLQELGGDRVNFLLQAIPEGAHGTLALISEYFFEN